MNVIDYIPRHVEPRIREAMHQGKFVVIRGGRKSGKTRLAKKMAIELGWPFYGLQRQDIRAQVQDSPQAFIKSLHHSGAVVDGLQQVPELVELFKKEYVGRNRGAGKFLTTVTADTPFCDELVGGVSMDLYPPSQGELGLLRRPADFLECLLRASFRDGESWIGSDEVLLRAIKGGYLGSVLAVDFEARGLFFEDYIDKSHLSDFLVEEGLRPLSWKG